MTFDKPDRRKYQIKKESNLKENETLIIQPKIHTSEMERKIAHGASCQPFFIFLLFFKTPVPF
jgi:hypothetical protein